MRSLRYVIAGLGTSFFASVLLASVVLAQEVDQSAAQSANATRSINQSTVIPAPEPTFGGSIDKNASTSKAWWPPRIVPPQGAPDIFLVIVDDAGFASWSTFGGLIPTPVQDDLATQGLRYTNFHTTALCSPTRAALITGRNHHSVGFGVISELSTGYPGYDSIIGRDTATVSRILQANGYATAWFGKEHNTPPWEATLNGPFDHWPVGYGFDYFYGFIGGEANQWAPSLFENTTPVYPSIGHPGYNFNVDMADKAVSWLKRVDAVDPNKRVFLYYSPGAAHAPHQPTKDWINKFKGKFDGGWNAYREMAFERQKKLGVIPADAKLTPWPDFLPKWETLSPDQKKLYTREMEVYAAFLAETDYEIGRVIQAFKDTHRWDNTLTIIIDGDNGASAEGGPDGTFNEFAALNGIRLSLPQQLKYYDKWGGPDTQAHYAIGWAWATDTPFRWTKQVASFFGGTRNGVVITWPKRITDRGGIRNQFHHVIDITPTILDAVGIVQPDMVDGVKQRPIEGVSMLYTFDKANANAPSTHHTQYFEMFGARALYHDGWIASIPLSCYPWEETCSNATKTPANRTDWQLYDVSNDWTQYTDVAAKYPDKVKELSTLFDQEASKYNVYPMSEDKFARAIMPRPSTAGGRNQFVYTSRLVGVSPANAPNILNKSWAILAKIGIPSGGAKGMIVGMGGEFGGYGLLLINNHVTFIYNLLGLQTTKWEDPATLKSGDHALQFGFKYDGGGIAKGGTGTLSVDGKTVARKHIDATVPFSYPIDDGFSVTSASATPLSHDYSVPFDFSGTLTSVTITLFPETLTPQERLKLEEGLGRDWLTVE